MTENKKELYFRFGKEGAQATAPPCLTYAIGLPFLSLSLSLPRLHAFKYADTYRYTHTCIRNLLPAKGLRKLEGPTGSMRRQADVAMQVWMQ